MFAQIFLYLFFISIGSSSQRPHNQIEYDKLFETTSSSVSETVHVSSTSTSTLVTTSVDDTKQPCECKTTPNSGINGSKFWNAIVTGLISDMAALGLSGTLYLLTNTLINFLIGLGCIKNRKGLFFINIVVN